MRAGIWSRGVVSGCLLLAALAAPAAADLSRPDPEGTPTRVSVGLYVLDLVSIDDAAEEFTADLLVNVRWRDPRLAHTEPGTAPAYRAVPISEIWTPELVALNRREVTPLLPQVARVTAGGEVTYEQRFYGTLGVRLDLRAYPGDSQELPIRVVSYRYSTDEVELEIDPRSSLLPDPSIDGWQIEAGEPEIEPLSVPGVDHDFAGLSFKLTAKREVAHYVLSIALPLLLIAAMAWSVFWIPPQFLPSQTSLATASVFTLIAFRFSVTLSLPKISYLTVADRFVLCVTFLVFGALGAAILTGRLAKTGRERQAEAIDRWARWIYLAALAALCVWALG